MIFKCYGTLKSKNKKKKIWTELCQILMYVQIIDLLKWWVSHYSLIIEKMNHIIFSISIAAIEKYWSGHTRLDTSSSFPNLEIKQSRATSVLGWATSRERAVLLPFWIFFPPLFLFLNFICIIYEFLLTPFNIILMIMSFFLLHM